MKFSVFTSCALNYLPKARALACSLHRHQPDARLTLCLNDQIPGWLDLSSEPFDQIVTPSDLGYDHAWIFQHNVMELCTAVKGRALRRLLEEEGTELAVYLDPDVYVLHPLEPIFQMMEGASIGLVPHILRPEATDIGVQLTEMSVAAHGTYNLGHLVVRPDSNGHAFAQWWTERLDKYCYDDRNRGLFTDQRWVDLAPALFPGVRILRTASLDVASWNLSGREIAHGTGGNEPLFVVNGEPLISYHFSGTGPSGAHRRIRESFDSGNAATAEIERLYEAEIDRHGQRQLSGYLSPFETFDDGTRISPAARKLYREHGDLRRAFPDPYRHAPAEATYLTWLREHRPQMVRGLILPEARLRAAFDDLFDEAYYLDTYPDAVAAIEAGTASSAIQHYCKIGSRLFMDPNEFFVSADYFDQACGQDRHLLTGAAGQREGTLLWHYLVSGLPSGIEPIEFFDSSWYLAQNPDVDAALRTGRVTTPLAHFLQNGSAEGRDPGARFSGSTYASVMSPDGSALKMAAARRGPFGAFVRAGGVAGRVGHIAGTDTAALP